MHEAYAGKPKGMRQVLWERGLYAEGMSASVDAPAEKKMDDIISNLPDFKNEKSALQHTVEGRGHILLLSPKFHPEVAARSASDSASTQTVPLDHLRGAASCTPIPRHSSVRPSSTEIYLLRT